jgi:hypothetical protein
MSAAVYVFKGRSAEGVGRGEGAGRRAANRRRICRLFASEGRGIAHEQEERQSLAMADENIDLRFRAEQGCAGCLPAHSKEA